MFNIFSFIFLTVQIKFLALLSALNRTIQRKQLYLRKFYLSRPAGSGIVLRMQCFQNKKRTPF